MIFTDNTGSKIVMTILVAFKHNFVIVIFECLKGCIFVLSGVLLKWSGQALYQ
jgi:hypothetical protein